MPEIRLIDANALKEHLKTLEAHSDHTTYTKAMQDMIDYYFPKIIDSQPTIEAEPVRDGRWIVHTTWHGMFGLIHIECSECKFDRNGDLSSWKFCPKCGARMDGGAAQ